MPPHGIPPTWCYPFGENSEYPMQQGKTKADYEECIKIKRLYINNNKI